MGQQTQNRRRRRLRRKKRKRRRLRRQLVDLQNLVDVLEGSVERLRLERNAALRRVAELEALG